jgi:cytochrome c553
VGNDGSVIYTRWDYVDRHTNLAHSLWSCRPDGTQPFALYGNYNAERKPWGEWHAQPVPGSHKLMAVAGAHHGYAYGSLVLIDPRQGYDGLGSVQRLTPEVPFPEAEGYPGQAYTTPYPLSEDFWLTSYSPEWSTRNASHATTQGLYLQDRFGNRELIYRDPGISCEYARPVRARRRPPAYAEIGADAPACGTMLLTNAYDSALDLPRVEITALRVVQVLPKTTPNADDPPISAARQVSARQLLGTVPVEQDGSACFVAPAGVPLYLQTVGADGMAVQTMRSLTYLQPGETTACVGCHEPRNTTPANRVPLALRRPPSTLAPGPEGSLPFSYPRLVQPVWDRHCVACHGATEPAGGMCLTGGLPDGSAYSHSYRALARKEWVHWFDSVNGGEWIALTTPGQFGARASRLSAFLRSGHGGVVLPAEDLARVNLWLDVNVPFYGAYEARHVAAQRESEAIPLGELLP